mmetsp:Transcript_27923/g.46296  ORF Transcript_27923/g.46296 Transcript_27923/m.46296 type:complete len:115 (-) Transcript_27923:381-725(-)
MVVTTIIEALPSRRQKSRILTLAQLVCEVEVRHPKHHTVIDTTRQQKEIPPLGSPVKEMPLLEGPVKERTPLEGQVKERTPLEGQLLTGIYPTQQTMQITSVRASHAELLLGGT